MWTQSFFFGNTTLLNTNYNNIDISSLFQATKNSMVMMLYIRGQVTSAYTNTFTLTITPSVTNAGMISPTAGNTAILNFNYQSPTSYTSFDTSTMLVTLTNLIVNNYYQIQLNAMVTSANPAIVLPTVALLPSAKLL